MVRSVFKPHAALFAAILRICDPVLTVLVGFVAYRAYLGTFSPPDRAKASLLGWFEEYAVPVTDLERSRAYWEALGFVTAAEEDNPWPHLSLTSDTLDLGLYLTREIDSPTLVFSSDNLSEVRQQLAALGVEPERKLPKSLDPATHLMLLAPEGTNLLITPPPA